MIYVNFINSLKNNFLIVNFFILVLLFSFFTSLSAQNSSDKLDCSRKKSGNIPHSGNPIIEDIFTADPSTLVHNDTLYLFTGHDEQKPGNDWFLMDDWHVFSTTDMVNWKDHGEVLTVDDFSWSKFNAFAGHCTYHKGKFWWYVPMVHNTIKEGEGFAIGVAVSDHPAGPYKDPIGKPIITDTTQNAITLNIDPAVYVDDDGQVYMFWGSWGECRVVKLKDNMTEMDGPVKDVPGLTHFFEAPYIHKYEDTYYLSYAAKYPSETHYATSESITGPWEYQGKINDVLENSPTNHQAIVEYKDHWYFFYNNAGAPGGGPYRRSVCVDLLEYDQEGNIKKIQRTSHGVPSLDTTATSDEQTALNKNREEDMIEVFPNPSDRGSVFIKFNESLLDSDFHYKLYDITGACCYTGNFNNSNQKLSLNLKTGAYIFHLRTDEATINKKIYVTN